MTRSLKILGPAILAALAVSVMVASIGSADEGEKFTAGSYPATLHSASGVHTFTFAGGRKFECATTISGELTEASEKVKLIPKYSECTTLIGGVKLPSTTTASCEAGLDHYNILFFFTRTKCEKGYTHHVSVYNDAKHTELLCKYEIFANEGEKVTHENLGGTNGIKVTWEIAGIKYKRITGTAVVCGPAESTSTYSGTSTVTAKDKEGKTIGFDIG